MKTLFQYEFRNQRFLRMGLLLPVLIIQMITCYFRFMFFSYNSLFILGRPERMEVMNAYLLDDWWRSTLDIVIGLTTVAVVVLCLLGDFMMLDKMGKASCMEYMIPVAGWKRLLAKLSSVFGWDVLCIGIFFVETATYAILEGMVSSFGGSSLLLESSFGSGNLLLESSVWRSNLLQEAFFRGILFILNYLLVLVAIFFGIILHKTVFAGKKWAPGCSLVTAAVAVWILNLTDFLVLRVQQGGWKAVDMFVMLDLRPTFNPLMMTYLILLLAKSVLLFVLSSIILERKLNL